MFKGRGIRLSAFSNNISFPSLPRNYLTTLFKDRLDFFNIPYRNTVNIGNSPDLFVQPPFSTSQTITNSHFSWDGLFNIGTNSCAGFRLDVFLQFRVWNLP